MNTELWRVQFLASLDDLSDLARQRQDWIDSAPPTGMSPTELVCAVFDDSAIHDLMNAGTVFSSKVDPMLRGMSELAGTIDVSQSPEALLRDESWLRLASLAGRVAQEIRCLPRSGER